MLPINKIRLIGQGGLGIVSLYQANDGQQFAVKQMLYQWNNDHFERFKREINIMTNLAHKNIVRLLNYNIDINNPWYVMPFYADGSLRDKLKYLQMKSQAYSSNDASSIIYFLADALSHAHNQGIVHRDLKPENILFNGNDPMLADWGIGKLIHRQSKNLTNGGCIGTPLYCAPEQWATGNADNRADIYSLGIIYRELLTGSTTGRIEDFQINAIVDKMTMQSPSNRYPSMAEVMKDIEKLNKVNITDPMSGFGENLAKLGLAALGVYVFYQLFAE